jgi:hypothetical protein
LHAELYHFGIKGQKWGVRRYQNKDGSLTNAGKKRYNVLGEKLEKHKQHLIDKYKAQGKSDEEAVKAAEKRIKIETVMVGAAALTITAAGVYAANKAIRDRTDQIIKAGETLQRVEMQDTGGKLNNEFFISKGKHDNKRYGKLLSYARKAQTGEAYMMKLEANNDIKVASNKKAAQVFGDLYKNDPEFRKAAEGYVGNHFSSPFVNRRNVNNVSDRNIRKMYDNFNSNIIIARANGDDIGSKFYNKLKSEGYGAIQDINDMKYSGYNAKNPLIVFDNSKGNITVKTVKEIKDSEIGLLGKAMPEMGKAKVEGMMKNMASVKVATLASGAAALTIASDYSTPTARTTTKTATKTAVNNQVRRTSLPPAQQYAVDYLKKHPNTNLTKAQLMRQYARRNVAKNIATRAATRRR